jgi:hypothetical protein
LHAGPLPQLQAPFEHPLAVAPHAVHIAPFVPHAPAVGSWHAPLAEQHPPAHDALLQTQLPLWQT